MGQKSLFSFMKKPETQVESVVPEETQGEDEGVLHPRPSTSGSSQKEDMSEKTASSSTSKEDFLIQTDIEKEESKGSSKTKRNFQKGWLVTYPWLTYDKNKDLMFCKECLTIKAVNSMTQGSNNFRTSTLTRHLICDDHKRSQSVPKEKKNMDQAKKHAFSQEEKAVFVAMEAVYWLCQESLPMHKYPSLIAFLKHLNVPNIEHLQITEKINYSSETSAKDLLTAMSEVIDETITEKVQDAPAITLFTDESTDIVVNHKLAISIRIVDPITLNPSTHFLTDVQIRDATGAGIFASIREEFSKRNINISKVYGLGTDGASVMTGDKTGLTGQFKSQNPHIKNNHCSAHRVALISQQAAENIPAIHSFQETVTSIYYYFHKSPKRYDQLESIQKLLDDPVLKFKEVHSVRWLSFYKSVETIYKTLDSLLTYFDALSVDNDPRAKGLKKKIAQELFISITYGMMDWLKPIMILSLFFQKKNIDIGLVKVSVQECIDDLTKLRNNTVVGEHSENLGKDLINGCFKVNHDVTRNAQHFESIRTKFLDQMIQGLNSRFPDMDTMNQFAVFGMRPLSHMADDNIEEINEWGNKQITTLSDFYTQKQTYKKADGNVVESEPFLSCKTETILREWKKCKTIVVCNKYSTCSISSLWGALANLQEEGGLECPNILKLASLALTHPIHSCDVERAFSVQNLTLSALRNRLSPDVCDKLMRIKIEGGSMETFDFASALDKWSKSKHRKIKV